MLRVGLVFTILAAACGSSDGVHHLPDAPELGCDALVVDAASSDLFTMDVGAVPASGFTWELWFNAAMVPTSPVNQIQLGATMMVAADGISCEDSYLGFGSEMSPARELGFVLDGSGECGARDTAPIHFAPPAGFMPNHWYFVAVSHDYGTGESKLYLDGMVVASKISTVTPITGHQAPITLGRWTDRKNTSYNQFHGALDEVAISGRVLTDAEVVTDYGNGIGRYWTGVEPDLIVGFHFDESAGSLAQDFAGRKHDGTLEGATWQPGIVCRQ